MGSLALSDSLLIRSGGAWSIFVTGGWDSAAAGAVEGGESVGAVVIVGPDEVASLVGVGFRRLGRGDVGGEVGIFKGRRWCGAVLCMRLRKRDFTRFVLLFTTLLLNSASLNSTSLNGTSLNSTSHSSTSLNTNSHALT